MKRIKIIYNPSSGRQIIQRRIDSIYKIFMDNGYIIDKFATKKRFDAMNEAIKCCEEDWDALIACGGDGTVNEIASGVIKGGRKIPVGILASGTVNDFANYMGLPRTPKEFCDMIMNGKTMDVDTGKYGDRYFVNVAAGGVITNVAHQVSSELKTALGRVAYYIEGIRDIPRHMFKPFKASIYSEEYKGEEEVLLFLICNSSSIGGFRNLAKGADVQDGYLDCIIIKKSEIQDIVLILINLLRGELANHPNVTYFKTKKVSIRADKEVHVDLDGEYGGTLISSFEVLPNSFKIFIK